MPMDTPIHISRCGLNCHECKAFKATQADDDAMRSEVAAEWTTLYKTPIASEDINCSGCREVGIKFKFAEYGCDVRKCCGQRGHAACAECPDYTCDKLDAIHKFAPQARKQLDALRDGCDSAEQ